MATIDEQIRANNAKIEANSSRISELKLSAKSWMSDGDNDKCKQLSKRKKQQCIDEKNAKIDLANSRLEEAKTLESLNNQIFADNQALIKQREAEAQSIVALSQKGTSAAAIQTKAEAEAKATQKIAEAQAQAIQTMASKTPVTQPTNENNTKNTIVVVSIVLILIVSVIVITKKLKAN